MIYGRGDHLLDHLSRAFHTFPIFGLVGLRDRPVLPVAVADVTRLLAAAARGDGRLRNRTLFALGPDGLTLSVAVRRVAGVVGRRPLLVPLPVAVHRGHRGGPARSRAARHGRPEGLPAVTTGRTSLMRVLLVNPPIRSIVSDLGVGHQMPLGLLMIGGPIIDAGHEVMLLGGAANHLDPGAIGA
jgi:hypothetical protein